MPVEGPVTDSSMVSGSRSTQRAQFYPSPFFDIAGTYFPETPKALFRFCRYYYYTVGVIGAAVDIHAAYPVTDVIIDEEDEELRKRWKQILDEQFKIKSFMIEAGKDKVCLGNSLISLHIPFKRFLVCPACREKRVIDDPLFQYEFKNFAFSGICPKCGNHGKYAVQDEPIKDIKRANLIRWAAENIDIEYNPITGEHFYKYSIPNEIKRMIVQGRRHIIERIPMVFIEAMRDNAPIIFNSDNIFHMKRASLAEKNMGWGEPAMIRVLKDLYYLQVLKKAREQVAHQHIVPLWVLFPQPQGELNPYEHLNLAEWRGRVEQEIKNWRQDPNYIPVMPIPLGFQFIGGNFKSLDTTPEMQNLLLNILAGMNMPQEFVYGGLQYSGTSFSIRMLANLFNGHRAQLLEFINGFLIPRLSEVFNIKPVKVHFTELKLADDVQKKQLMFQLNAANKVSDATMLSEFGLDSASEAEKIKAEMKRQGEILAAQMIEQEKAKAEAMLANVRGQIKGQLMQNTIALDVQEELMKQQVQFDRTQPFKINPDLFPAIFKADPKENPYRDENGKPFFVLNPVSLPATVKSLAKSMMAVNDQKRQELMGELQANMPMMADLVGAEMGAMGGPQGGPPGQNGAGKRPLPTPKVDMRPMPTQKPPRRAGGAS
jgi:hypothetical protein